MTTEPVARRFRSMADVKRANQAADQHWFDEGALRFFDSRIDNVLHAGRYFITSEQFHGSTHSNPRRWSIREVSADGSIETVGDFQAYASHPDALIALRELLDQD